MLKSCCKLIYIKMVIYKIDPYSKSEKKKTIVTKKMLKIDHVLGLNVITLS